MSSQKNWPIIIRCCHEGKWWHKFSGPLSALLMPLLGAVAAFGLARSGALLVRAIIGMALGFAYFVFDNAALAMGNFGGYPPLVAAWGPFLLFLLVGETVLVRTEEYGCAARTALPPARGEWQSVRGQRALARQHRAFRQARDQRQQAGIVRPVIG